MRSGRIFVVACLLLASGCVPLSRAYDHSDEVEARAEIVADVGAGAGVLEVEALPQVQQEQPRVQQEQVVVDVMRVQRKAVKQSHRKVGRMKGDVDALHHAVRIGRFRRLDGYAKKQGWLESTPPPEAVRDDRLRGWWQEWRSLKKTGLR